MKHPLSRFAPPCVRRRRPLFGRVQACAGRLGAAALSPSLASREGNDALTAGGPLLGVPAFWQRRLQSLGVVVNAIEN